MFLLTASTLSLAASVAGATQDPGTAWIAINVVDVAGSVAGATVTSEPPGMVRYNGTNGLPSPSATATGSDGIAYIFSVAPGNVRLSASKPGTTFVTRAVAARADTVTITTIE